jgi:hypothetical protein
VIYVKLLIFWSTANCNFSKWRCYSGRWKGYFDQLHFPQVKIFLRPAPTNFYGSIYLLLMAVLRCDISAAWSCFTSYNTRQGLCSLFLSAIVLRSPPPSHVYTFNGQRSSQLFFIHYNSARIRRSLTPSWSRIFPFYFRWGVCFWSRDWLLFFTCSGDFKCVTRFPFFDASLSGSNSPLGKAHIAPPYSSTVRKA